MRLKRKDKTRKILQFYSRTYNIKDPYKIVVDADFLFAALKSGVSVYDTLQKFFEDKELKLFCSPCVRKQIVDLAQTPGPYTKDWQGVVQILTNKANRVQWLKCPHGKEPIAAHDCLVSNLSATHIDPERNGHVGKKKGLTKQNAHKLILCGQHSELRQKCRLIPGVPIAFIQSNFLILEEPSQATQKFGQQIKRVQEHSNPSAGGRETGLDVIERLTQFAPVKVEELAKIAEKFSKTSTTSSGGEYRAPQTKEQIEKKLAMKKKYAGKQFDASGKVVKSANPLSCMKAKAKQMPSNKEENMKRKLEQLEKAKKQQQKQQKKTTEQPQQQQVNNDDTITKTTKKAKENKANEAAADNVIVQLPKPQQPPQQPQPTQQPTKDTTAAQQENAGKKRKRTRKKKSAAGGDNADGSDDE